MDALLLGRMQFATTTSIHFLFVLLTLGLVTLVAIMQTRWALTGNPVHARMTRFWGHLYVINYALGIVSGIAMEFQFGLNWSGLSRFVGNVFGAPLALETLIAFFLESTFLGLWIFGWNRLNRWVHLALIWLVTLTAYASAFWVLVANTFMQNPVGYQLRDGIAHLTDFGALLSQDMLWMTIAHVLSAALTTGGIFLAGVSAFHLLRRTKEQDFFRRSTRLGVVVAAVGSLFTVGFGFAQFGPLGAANSAKLAVSNPEYAAVLQAKLTAEFGPGDYVPPAWIQTAFRIMQDTGFLLQLASFVALLLLIRNLLFRLRWLLFLLPLGIPLTFAAAIAGWLYREVGRQPWVVTNLLRTQDAVSDVSAGAMAASFVTFTVLLAGLALTNWFLIARAAIRGPAATPWADDVPHLTPVPALAAR